jgi:hypothetical protein
MSKWYKIYELWILYKFFYWVCEAIGSAATPGLLRQPRVIVKMIVEKWMECRLAGETEVLGENLPQRHICQSQHPTWPDRGLNPGRRVGKPATNRLSYGAASRNELLLHAISIYSSLSEYECVIVCYNLTQRYYNSIAMLRTVLTYCAIMLIGSNDIYFHQHASENGASTSY